MKTIIQDDVKFKINDTGLLYEMKNVHKDQIRINATIPDAISGTKITALGKSFCVGLFENVTVPSGVETVNEEAFKNAFVHSVSWPSSCTKIPAACFEDSQLKQITGIENVTDIGPVAFLGTGVEEFEWPKKCETIPVLCFSKSRIHTLSGTEHVKTIGHRAFASSCLKNISSIKNVERVGSGVFANTNIQKLEWPSKCKYIPSACFSGSGLVSLTNLQNIETIGECAFSSAFKLKNLDLTNLMILSIGNGAFAEVDPKEVKLPYYIDNSVFIAQKAPSC